MRIFGSCLMIAVTAENLGDLDVLLKTKMSFLRKRESDYSGLKKRAPQAKATACAGN